ncbi:hypothetical protein ACM7YY_09310 [Pseudomonas aeruginosa]
MTETTAQMAGYICRNQTLILAYGTGFFLKNLPFVVNDIASRMGEEPVDLPWLSVSGYVLIACCFGYGIRTVTTRGTKVALCLAMVVSLISVYGALRPLVTGWVMAYAAIAMLCIGVGLGFSGFRQRRGATEAKV